MANMSYCRFYNTNLDFADCLDALETNGLDSLSEMEQQAAEQLFQQCLTYVEEYASQKGIDLDEYKE